MPHIFFPDDTSFVLTHRENKCRLQGRDSKGITQKFIDSLPIAQSYSIYGDSEKKCLIADKVNGCLVSINKDSIVETYNFKSIKEPYAMTFLSNGTLCVTDWNQSAGTRGGIVIISENDLKTNK